MNLIDALKEFEEALNTLDLRLAEYAAENADAAESAEALAKFEQIRLNQFKVVQENFFNLALGCMSEGQSIQVGDQVVTKGWTEKKSKWRHDELREHIFQRLVDLSTTDDGEITLTPRQAVDKLFSYAHVDYWRKKSLSELDINPDRFVDLTDEKEVVTVRKAMK